MNHKRVYRLYSAANLAVRKRKKVRLPASERVPLQLARAVNDVWSMDFSMVRPRTASSFWALLGARGERVPDGHQRAAWR